MEINRAAFGALAIIGVTAAGAGAYLANRQNDIASAQLVPVYETPAGSAVTETEGAISTTPANALDTASPFVAPEPPAPAPRAERRPAPVRTASSSPRTRTSPGYTGSNSPSPSYTPPRTPVESTVASAVEPVDNTTVERGPIVQEAPRKIYDDLVIPADSVIGLQVETAVSTENAKLEDQVRARVTRDVKVRDQVAIPAGARAEGSVTVVERGGRLKDQARLGIRFHTIVLADGTRLPINTETIYREGDSPARESAAKIGGGAVGGAVLGAIFGGKKGAVIGSTVGAAGGGVAVAASEPNAATLPAGSTVTVRMGAPATVTVER